MIEAEGTRYFLRFDLENSMWQEVTRKDFIRAERAAGFYPKFGGGGVATAGFSNGFIEGKVVYSTTTLPVTYMPISAAPPKESTNGEG